MTDKSVLEQVYLLQAKQEELQLAINNAKQWLGSFETTHYNKLGIPVYYDNKMPLHYNLDNVFTYLAAELRHINKLMGEIPLELRMSISGKIARSEMKSKKS